MWSCDFDWNVSVINKTLTVIQICNKDILLIIGREVKQKKRVLLRVKLKIFVKIHS